MNAWVINVGDEVLSGKTINSNASFIAQALESIGIAVSKVLVVSDNTLEIQEAVNMFMQSSAVVLVTTGGLGPTHDDITKEAIAEYFNRKLVYSKEAANDMYQYFKENKQDVNLKQTWIPEGACLIANKLGSADGVILEEGNKKVFMLVGPPYENQPMIEETVLPYLKKFADPVLLQDYICLGESESYFEGLLQGVFSMHPEVQISPYADNGRVRYRLLSKATHQTLFDEVKVAFESIMNSYIVSKNNESIEEVVVRLLKEQNKTISFAESCTGGMLSSLVTSVSGASAILSESYVVYSEKAKAKILGVSNDTMASYGVVSNEVAREMVLGLYNITQSDVCVAVTGYAGPLGDVGRVSYAIKIGSKMFVEEKRFRGNREMIRTRVARYLLYLVCRNL